MKKKGTVKATIPGVGEVEISKERAEQIRNLQKLIKEGQAKKEKEQKQ